MLIITLLLGMAGGFILSTPPGPLAIAVTKQGLEGHFRAGLMLASAAAVMDVVYILLSAFASSAIVQALDRLIKETVWFPLLFQIACVILLLVLGIRYFTPEQRKRVTQHDQRAELAQEERARQMGHATPFFTGLLIAITNLASPTFLPSMIAFVGFFHANDWLPPGVLPSVLFSIGFGLGTLLWFVGVLRVLLRFRTSISNDFLSNIYRFTGGTLITFAAVITYHVVTATAWGRLM
jgi:threonine/homoserine/homoserine lactone efflux protein